MEKHFQQFLRTEKELKPPLRHHQRNSQLATQRENLTSQVRHYFDVYQRQTESVTRECSFSPSLRKTAKYNKHSPSVSVVEQESTFERNMGWVERRERSLDFQRMVQRVSLDKENTFQPAIEPLVIKNRQDSLRIETPQIPEDNESSRSQFKKIKGMEKFL